MGGVLRLLLYNVQELKSRGVYNVVIFFNQNESARHLFDAAGIEVIHVPYRSVFSFLSVVTRLIFLARTYKPSILHSHLPFDVRFSFLVSKLVSIPLVITLHFLSEKEREGSMRHRFNLWMFRLGLGQARKIIAVSDFLRSTYPKKFQDKMVVIHSGVPDSSLHTVATGKFYSGFPKLLCVGRSHPVKGHEYLPDLVKLLKKTFPKVELILFTSKPEAYEYGRSVVEKIQREGLGQSIRIVEDTGDPGQLQALYQEAECFILPSKHESFSIAALEAMSYGLPIVASNAGGIPEAVKSGFNGYLFSVGDVNEASICVVKIFENNYSVYRANARKYFCENFSVEVSIEQLMRTYEGISH